MDAGRTTRASPRRGREPAAVRGSTTRADADAARVARNIELHALCVQAAAACTVPKALLAPDFRMENRVTAVTDQCYRGEDGWREWMSDLFDVFADGARYEVEEIVAAGHDYVAAMLRVSGRGARSGQPLSFRWAGVTWFRGEQALRAVGYATREQALAAVAATDAPASR